MTAKAINTIGKDGSNGQQIDLGHFLDNEVIPRLPVEAVFTHPAHHFQRSGNKLRGGCPWHDSKSGTAFYIDAPTLRWRCPACCIGGGPVQYLHKLRGGSGLSPKGKDFIDILRELSDRAGVTMPEREMSEEERKRLHRREARRAVLESAYSLCDWLLRQEQGVAAREYLLRRGFVFFLFLLPPAVDDEVPHGRLEEVAEPAAPRVGPPEVPAQEAHGELLGQLVRLRRVVQHAEQVVMDRAVVPHQQLIAGPLRGAAWLPVGLLDLCPQGLDVAQTMIRVVRLHGHPLRNKCRDSTTASEKKCRRVTVGHFAV